MYSFEWIFSIESKYGNDIWILKKKFETKSLKYLTCCLQLTLEWRGLMHPHLLGAARDPCYHHSALAPCIRRHVNECWRVIILLLGIDLVWGMTGWCNRRVKQAWHVPTVHLYCKLFCEKNWNKLCPKKGMSIRWGRGNGSIFCWMGGRSSPQEKTKTLWCNHQMHFTMFKLDLINAIS